MEPILLTIDKIRLDGGTQPRAQLDMLVVSEYAQAMQQGETFPAIIVFYDGEFYWLADGFHRVSAALQIDADNVLADVRQGTRRDAILHACGANSAHGLRRTNSDKRRVVEMMMGDAEWSAWSDREIARRCAVSDRFVGIVRQELSTNGSQMATTARKVERNGKTYTMDTANIGQAQEPSAPPAIEIEFEGDKRPTTGDDRGAEVEPSPQAASRAKSNTPTSALLPDREKTEQLPGDVCPKCKTRPVSYQFDRKRSAYKCYGCGCLVDVVVTRAKAKKAKAGDEAQECPACGKLVAGSMCENCGEVIRG